MTALVDIFALLTAAAGWYYIFYSRAAQRLEPLEAQDLNRVRIKLRRAGGAAMMLLGILFFAGFQNLPPLPFVVVWIGALLTLAAIVVLGLFDLRLTFRLQQRRRKQKP